MEFLQSDVLGESSEGCLCYLLPGEKELLQGFRGGVVRHGDDSELIYHVVRSCVNGEILMESLRRDGRSIAISFNPLDVK